MSMAFRFHLILANVHLCKKKFANPRAVAMHVRVNTALIYHDQKHSSPITGCNRISYANLSSSLIQILHIQNRIKNREQQYKKQFCTAPTVSILQIKVERLDSFPTTNTPLLAFDVESDRGGKSCSHHISNTYILPARFHF